MGISGYLISYIAKVFLGFALYDNIEVHLPNISIKMFYITLKI